jgi:hypothetical protein
MRWMHVAPQRADVEACDRLGIVEVCPAGDKERTATGRQWDQRAEVMRASMIFYRNNPSIFFWEAGNTVVTPEQMVQLVAMRKEVDPHGGRVVGTRGNSDGAANNALTPVSEYYGVMLGQDTQTDTALQDATKLLLSRQRISVTKQDAMYGTITLLLILVSNQKLVRQVGVPLTLIIGIQRHSVLQVLHATTVMFLTKLTILILLILNGQLIVQSI